MSTKTATATLTVPFAVAPMPLYGRKTWVKQIRAYYPSLADISLSGNMVLARRHGQVESFTLGTIQTH